MKTGEALIEEIGGTELGPGELAFWWLGQLSFVVKLGRRVILRRTGEVELS